MDEIFPGTCDFLLFWLSNAPFIQLIAEICFFFAIDLNLQLNWQSLEVTMFHFHIITIANVLHSDLVLVTMHIHCIAYAVDRYLCSCCCCCCCSTSMFYIILFCKKKFHLDIKCYRIHHHLLKKNFKHEMKVNNAWKRHRTSVVQPVKSWTDCFLCILVS